MRPVDRPLVDSEGAAKYLGVSERAVRRWVAQRKIPFLKLNKFIRFELDDLDEWKRRNRTLPEGWED